MTLTNATVYADTCERNCRATMRDERPKASFRWVSWVDDDEDGSGSEGGCVRCAATPPHLAANKQRNQLPALPPHGRTITDLGGRGGRKVATLSVQLAEVLKKNAPPDRQRSPSLAPRREKAFGLKPRGPCYACGEEGHFRQELMLSVPQSKQTKKEELRK